MKTLPLVLVVFQMAATLSFGVSFEDDVLPIFQSKCSRCHMDGSSKGGLSLDAEEISKHIRSSKQINPGNASRSLLVDLIESDDPDDRMPPKGAPVSAAQIEMIRSWIDEGAKLAAAETETPEAEEGAMAPKLEPLTGTFTNRDGAAITATILRIEGSAAVLRRDDGREFSYPLANFSAPSQSKIKEWLEGAP